MTDSRSSVLISASARIVAAYVSNNAVYSGTLSTLIPAVHRALDGLDRPAVYDPAPLAGSVSIRHTVKRDYIISLEDGKRYRVLTRHLRKFGLTPEKYREKWDLAVDYPMTAPSYSEVRSRLAKRSGLGRKFADPVSGELQA